VAKLTIASAAASTERSAAQRVGSCNVHDVNPALRVMQHLHAVAFRAILDIVAHAVDLDGKTSASAREVENVATDGMLPAKDE
jgi:hypothetical protein